MATSGSPASSAENEARIDLLLLGEPGVLELDVGGVAPEDLRESVEVLAGVLPAPLDERARDAPRETPGERDEAFRMALQKPQSTRGL